MASNKRPKTEVTADVVLTGGRCIDPETGLDALRTVVIKDGAITALLEPACAVPAATVVFDCSGLVVAPGFIDLHSHGAAHQPTARLQALDGVTFQGELEFGVSDVDEWFVERERAGSLLHYGCTVGHIPVRVAVMGGGAGTRAPRSRLPPWHKPHSAEPHLLASCACTSSASHLERASEAQREAIAARLEGGLRAGACGVGMGIAYTGGADSAEIFRLFQLGARWSAPLYVHTRGTMEDLRDWHELLACAAASGAPLHLCHINSSVAPAKLEGARTLLTMLDGITSRGLDVTAEAYPYSAGMTRLDSGVFDEGWERRLGITPADVEWIATGERLSEATFAARKAEGGLVAIHSIPREVVDMCIAHPAVIVASDAIPFGPDGKGHPRGSGCFTRVLASHVRERCTLSLIAALRKMTLLPAQRLEGACSAFRKKGRLQVGCDADIVAFDAVRVQDMATFAQPTLPSRGVQYLLVGGRPLVVDGAIVDGILPGKPYRADWPSGMPIAEDCLDCDDPSSTPVPSSSTPVAPVASVVGAPAIAMADNPASSKASSKAAAAATSNVDSGSGASDSRPLPLASCVGFVTGAGAGIGRGVAIALARQGCAVVVVNDLPCARASVEETASAVRAVGCRATLALADVSDAEEIGRAVQLASREHGRIDIVVANAAWSERLPVVQQPAETVRRVLEVSQMGVLNTVKASAVQMRGQGGVGGRECRGKILIISSIMGSLVLSKASAAYAMSKAAVTHLGRCLASELSDDRINVNVILPGWIDTPGERKFTSEETIARLAPQMPWGRLGTPDDIGRAAAFLCSSSADYITGSTLTVDGGYTVSVRLPFGDA